MIALLKHVEEESDRFELIQIPALLNRQFLCIQ
jgi:hypothetical protein